MSDFSTKNGTEERGSSNQGSCVFDWTPDEAVGVQDGEVHSESHSSVVFESDIFPDARS